MAFYNANLINLTIATLVFSSLILIICVQPSSPETRFERSFPIGRPLRLYATGRSFNQLHSYKYPKTYFKKFPISWAMGRPDDDTDVSPTDNPPVAKEQNDDDGNVDSKSRLQEEQNPDDPLLLLLDSYPQLSENDWDMRAPVPRHETMSGTSQWNELQDNQSETSEVVPAELPKIGSDDTRKKREARNIQKKYSKTGKYQTRNSQTRNPQTRNPQTRNSQTRNSQTTNYQTTKSKATKYSLCRLFNQLCLTPYFHKKNDNKSLEESD